MCVHTASLARLCALSCVFVRLLSLSTFPKTCPAKCCSTRSGSLVLFYMSQQKTCAVGRKELATTWVSFLLFPPSMHPIPPCQLLSCLNVLCQHLSPYFTAGLERSLEKQSRSTSARIIREGPTGTSSVTKRKISAETLLCVRLPSATAMPVRSPLRAAVAVPKLLPGHMPSLSAVCICRLP